VQTIGTLAAVTPGDHVEIETDDTVWRFERRFMTSNWVCLFGHGCQGILAAPAPELGQGCCSIGADLDGEDEAMALSAAAMMLLPEQFERHADAAAGGVFADPEQRHTRVVDGACIFLNRPGFAGGAGCALHIAAVELGDSPIDWKPSVCWQLPVHVDWEVRDERTETATVRPWRRADWGEDGDTMAWCCTEGPEAFVGEQPVFESLAAELQAIAGEAVYVELRRRLTSG
jgi:hypothetical protein